MSPAMERAAMHVAAVLGPERARLLFEECLREAGLTDVTESAQLHRFGSVLVKRGGFLEVVGRFLRVQAISAECVESTERR